MQARFALLSVLLLAASAEAKVGPRDLSGYVGTDSLAPQITLPASFLEPSPSPSPAPTVTVLANANTLLSDGDDSNYAFDINAGGGVKVYGQSMSSCFASSNGFVACGGDPGALFDNRPLPDPRFANKFLFAPFWDDLSAVVGLSSIVTESSSTSFVVQWNDFALTSDPTARLTFRVVFQVGAAAGPALFQYMKMTGGAGAGAASATIGIQHANGFSSNQYSFNVAGATLTGTGASGQAQQAVLFDIDADGDRLVKALEDHFGTSDSQHDSDGAGADDGVEIANGKDPTDGADDASLGTTDSDGDTLSAAEETFYGTNPASDDSDGDNTGVVSLKDNDELYVTFTDPTRKDTDRDSFDDGVELDALSKPLDPTNHPALPDVNLSISAAGKYRPQAALDGSSNIHVVAGMSADNSRVGIYYWMIDKDGKVLIPETFIKVATPDAGAHSAHGLSVGVVGGKVYVVYELRTGRSEATLGFARINPALAPRDGSAVAGSTLLETAKLLSLPSDGIPNHANIAVATNGVHLVYRVDQALTSGDPPRLGFNYVQLSLDGTVQNGVRLLTNNHGHTHSRTGIHFRGSQAKVVVDAAGTAHIAMEASNRSDTPTYYAQVKNGVLSGPYFLGANFNAESIAIDVKGGFVYIAGTGRGENTNRPAVQFGVNLAVFNATGFEANPRVGDNYDVSAAMDSGAMTLPMSTVYLHNRIARNPSLKVLDSGAVLVGFHGGAPNRGPMDWCLASFAPAGATLGAAQCTLSGAFSSRPNRHTDLLVLPNGRVGFVYSNGKDDSAVRYTVMPLAPFDSTVVPPPPAITNQRPTITTTPPNNAYIGLPYTYAAAATDAETPASNLTWALGGAPFGMTVSASGTVSWTPISTQMGIQTAQLRACDTGTPTRCGEQAFTITVSNPLAPVITSTPGTVAVAGKPYTYQLGVFNPDDAISSYTLTTPAVGNMAVSATGLFTWTPGDADVGTVPVTLKVTDAGMLSASQSFALTVIPAGTDQPPVFTSLPATTVIEGTSYTYQAVAMDPDAPAATFTYSLTSAGSGDLSVSSSGLLTWKPGASEVGPVSVAIQATEDNSQTGTQTFTVIVLPKSATSDGCGCVVGGQVDHNKASLWLLSMALVFAWRLRRRSAR